MGHWFVRLTLPAFSPLKLASRPSQWERELGVYDAKRDFKRHRLESGDDTDLREAFLWPVEQGVRGA